MSKHKKKRRSRMTPEQRKDFLGHMAAYDNDDLPDGAWFAVLEEAAEGFFKERGLNIDRNDGAHMYIQSTNEARE